MLYFAFQVKLLKDGKDIPPELLSAAAKNEASIQEKGSSNNAALADVQSQNSTLKEKVHIFSLTPAMSFMTNVPLALLNAIS